MLPDINCDAPQSIYEVDEFSGAVHIFKGEVIRVKRIEEPNGEIIETVRFKVLNQYVGPSITEIDIQFTSGDENYPCPSIEPTFKENEIYLLSSHEDPLGRYYNEVWNLRIKVIDEVSSTNEIN